MINCFRVFAIAFTLSLLMLTSCTTTKPLEYGGYENLRISNVSTDPTVNVDVKLYNPNPVGLNIKAVSMMLEVDDKNIGNIDLDQSVKIKSKQEFTLPFTFSSTLPQVATLSTPALKNFFTGGEVPLKLSGTFTLQKFFLFKRTYDFEYKDNLRMKEIRKD
jgi:LEA14-like dessication related protein